MNGLYALKPWYARQLHPIVEQLDRHRVGPDSITVWGVLFGAAGGALVAFAPTGLVTALLVGVCVLARLACANMDGTLARLRAPRPAGRLHNELGDRLADLALLSGLLAHLPWAGLALFAATMPSWTALAVSASGGSRSNAGPFGKTERCAVLIVAALTGWFAGCAVALIIGSLATATNRLRLGMTELSEVRR